jgi:hypothetical protein
MATSCATLIQRTRRYLRDWPENDVLTASVASTTTTLSVADGTLYPKNWQIELEQEVLTVATTGTGTTVPVRRGSRGSTAASHANSSIVLLRPDFFSVEILDELNNALDACFPLIYKPTSVEYTGFLSSVYEYNIPNMTGLTVPIPYISKLEMKGPGELTFGEVRKYEIVRGETPFLRFDYEPTVGSTLRINGFGPFAHFAAITDTVDAYFPVHAQGLLPLYAASQLMASGETGRSRVDTLATDDREQANRTGSAMSVSQALYSRFLTQLRAAAMAPLSRHAKPTF